MFSSFPQKSPEQRQLKCGLLLNRGIESKCQRYGHSTVELQTGSTSGEKRRWPVPTAKMGQFSSIFLFVLATITFAAHAHHSQLTVATFNLHGFSTSSKYLKDNVLSHGGIWMVQEHWLSEQQFHRFDQLTSCFMSV